MNSIKMLIKERDNFWLVFCTAFAIGILTHGEMIFYKISMHDDIGLFFSSAGISQGRWAGLLYDKIVRILFGDKYSTPVFAGLFSILYIATGAWLLVDILRVKQKRNVVFITTLLMVFPSVAHTFLHMNVAPSLFLAFDLCLLATWLTAKTRMGWLYSIPLIAISLGLYQAYISFYLSVLLLLGVKVALESIKDFKKLALSGLGGAAGGIAVYVIVLKIFESIYGISASYMGMNKMLVPNIMGRFLSIKKCYIDYLLVLLNAYPELKTTVVMNWIYRTLFVCIVVCLLSLIWKNRTKNKLVIVLSILSFISLPIGTNAIYILGTTDTKVGFLSLYPMVLALISLPTLSDWIEDAKVVTEGKSKRNCFIDRKEANRSVNYVICFILFLICLNFIYMTNATYLRLSFLQEKVIAYQTTMVTRIKSAEGYRDEYPVIWVGEGQLKDESLAESYEWHNIRLAYAGDSYEEMINNYAWKRFMKEHVGYNPASVLLDEAPKSVQRAVDAMNCYPDDGSIKVIDEYVVIKFGEPGETNPIYTY